MWLGRWAVMETVELSYQTHQNTDVKSQMFLCFIMIIFIIYLAVILSYQLIQHYTHKLMNVSHLRKLIRTLMQNSVMCCRTSTCSKKKLNLFIFCIKKIKAILFYFIFAVWHFFMTIKNASILYTGIIYSHYITFYYKKNELLKNINDKNYHIYYFNCHTN